MERKPPTTLQEAILYFSDPKNTMDYLVAKRWPNGVFCPTCGSKEVRFLATRNVWECKTKHPKRQFSAKLGTIFEDSALGLDKWFTAIWMVANCKNGVSSYELHRTLGVTQKSAWFLLHRIRLALKNGSVEKLSGEVEADETFIGGKIQNMHKSARRRIQAKDGSNWGKTIVLGLLQRDGEVRASVAPNRKKHHVSKHLNEHLETGATLYTDEFGVYEMWAAENPEVAHEIINHLEGYVKGRVHTNSIENFWSLLKRTLKGTYVSVDPWHLFRYLDEQCFRYNNRKDKNDSDRFDLALTQVVGKRLTYDELTGKSLEAETL
jgi:transposase-like protein